MLLGRSYAIVIARSSMTAKACSIVVVPCTNVAMPACAGHADSGSLWSSRVPGLESSAAMATCDARSLSVPVKLRDA